MACVTHSKNKSVSLRRTCRGAAHTKEKGGVSSSPGSSGAPSMHSHYYCVAFHEVPAWRSRPLHMAIFAAGGLLERFHGNGGTLYSLRGAEPELSSPERCTGSMRWHRSSRAGVLSLRSPVTPASRLRARARPLGPPNSRYGATWGRCMYGTRYSPYPLVNSSCQNCPSTVVFETARKRQLIRIGKENTPTHPTSACTTLLKKSHVFRI